MAGTACCRKSSPAEASADTPIRELDDSRQACSRSPAESGHRLQHGRIWELERKGKKLPFPVGRSQIPSGIQTLLSAGQPA